MDQAETNRPKTFQTKTHGLINFGLNPNLSQRIDSSIKNYAASSDNEQKKMEKDIKQQITSMTHTKTQTHTNLATPRVKKYQMFFKDATFVAILDTHNKLRHRTAAATRKQNGREKERLQNKTSQEDANWPSQTRISSDKCTLQSKLAISRLFHVTVFFKGLQSSVALVSTKDPENTETSYTLDYLISG